MAKTLLYKLFGIGKLPGQYRTVLDAEGIVISDEGIRGTVTFKNFRGGGRSSNWKRQWFSSSIAVTGSRLICFRLRAAIIDVAFSDERIRSIEFSVEEGETLLAAFDASLFHADWSGSLEYRFRTPLAGRFLAEVEARMH